MRVVLPLKNKDDLGVGLVDLVQRHYVGVGLGGLQDGNLVYDVHTAVLALPTLPQELGSVLFPCCFLNALLHHRKLSPGNRRRERPRLVRRLNKFNHITDFSNMFGQRRLSFISKQSMHNSRSHLGRTIAAKDTITGCNHNS